MNAVVARGLVRRFESVLALDNLSFEASSGELFGLVGPDGAGKTTAIRALAGLIGLDAGEVRIAGSDPKKSDVREKLGLLPQQYSLYGDLSVRENLQFFARLYVLPRAAYKKRAERLLDITRLGPFIDRRADALSGGMYKKLALACALLHEPEVLILDEPTNGVDPVSRRELWALLYEFVHAGMTVVVSTPYMDEAERCHTVGLIHHGRMLAMGGPAKLLAEFDDEVYEARGGDRDRVDAALADLHEVRFSSPAGSRLRLIVAREKGAAVGAALRPFGADLVRVSPTFEDLFLTRIGQEAA
jgi:ABC-2 type transport system ATP-binding protein